MRNKPISTQRLVLIALFAAMTAVIAPFTIPMPFTPVPLSLCIFSVFLSGAVLDKYSAFISQTVYVLLGAVGLPVFSGFRGGFGIIAGVTGGYIVSYAFMAFIIALLLEKTSKSYLKYVLSMILSLIICYSLGSAWLAFVMNISIYNAFLVGAAPYIVFDIIKALICAGVAMPINKAIYK